jgi:hypothetical protein
MPTQVSPAPGPVKSRGGIDCRVYERLDCELPSCCQPASAFTSKESRWSATIRNISLGGASVNLRRRFEPGTGLAIELPGSRGGEPYTVLARVVHVRAQSDGTWALGCKFVSELGEDEVQRLLPAKSTEEQSKTVANVLWQLEIRPGAVFSYQIKNLHVPSVWPLPPAKIVTLRGKGQGDRWALKLRIVACSPQGEDWTVRCRLLTAPSAESLLQALSSFAAPA